MKIRILILFLKLLSVLPLGVARKVGSVLGACGWFLSTKMAKVSQINLALCFPELDENERKALAKISVKQTFITIAEMGAVWLWPDSKVVETIKDVEGQEVIDEARAQGRGMIVIAPHIGNWELLGLHLARCNFGELSQLYQAPKNQELNRLILNARSRSGSKLVETNRKGVASLLATLRKGEVVGILPDQVPPDSGGEFAPFFGNPALTMTLVSRLLQKTNAVAVMAYAKRQPDGFKVIFRKPESNLYSDNIEESLQALNASIESLIREAPEQYQWEYKRFKRQPEGRQKPY